MNLIRAHIILEARVGKTQNLHGTVTLSIKCVGAFFSKLP